MDLFQKKITKIIGVIIGVVLFIALIAGITYAWIVYRSENMNISGRSECFTINYTKGQNISDANAILFDESKIINDGKITIKDGMVLANVTVSIDSSCSISGEVEISMRVTDLDRAYTGSGESTGAFKYALVSYDPKTYSNINTSSLAGETFDIIKNGSITGVRGISQQLVRESLKTTSTGYMIIFYVDGDLAMDDAQDSTFSAFIEATARQVAN